MSDGDEPRSDKKRIREQNLRKPNSPQHQLFDSPGSRPSATMSRHYAANTLYLTAYSLHLPTPLSTHHISLAQPIAWRLESDPSQVVLSRRFNGSPGLLNSDVVHLVFQRQGDESVSISLNDRQLLENSTQGEVRIEVASLLRPQNLIVIHWHAPPPSSEPSHFPTFNLELEID